jgi:membrane protease YdiL (CAAX protease family)
VFLAVGDLRRGAFGRRGLSWAAILPLAAAVFALPLLVNLAFTVRPELGLLGKAVRALPAALAFGAINAAQEEFRFRMVFLARLLPVVGADRAVVMTAVLFGLAHWGGHPSGASGVVLAFLAGCGLALSMVETKGAAWAWTVHAVLDVLIYGSLLMAVR